MPNNSQSSSNDGNLLVGPRPEEFEINLFGPGYGESIVIHLGGGEWISIDSCHDPQRRPVGLQYLRQLGVAVSNQLRFVIATHWHDDHIRGLSDVVTAAESGRLVVSSAIGENRFLALVDAMRTNALLDTTGVDEWAKILGIIADRKVRGVPTATPICVVGERTLFNRPAGQTGIPACEIHSLSPSDASFLAACAKFADMFPPADSSKARVVVPAPNHISVVLWIKFGDVKIILGADLEQTAGADTGWTAIVESTTKPMGQASIFKIPHHGSQNGHNPEVWKTMVVAGATAILTPFFHGSTVLPTDSDIARIKAHAGASFITAAPTAGKTKRKRTNSVDRSVLEVVKSIRNVPAATGHIRMRYTVGGSWSVELFGTAASL